MRAAFAGTERALYRLTVDSTICPHVEQIEPGSRADASRTPDPSLGAIRTLDQKGSLTEPSALAVKAGQPLPGASHRRSNTCQFVYKRATVTTLGRAAGMITIVN